MSLATPRSGLPAPLSRATALARDALQRVAFWTAVVLPLVVVPLLTLEAFVSRPELVVGAIALDAVALVIGHGRPSRRRRERGDA